MSLQVASNAYEAAAEERDTRPISKGWNWHRATGGPAPSERLQRGQAEPNENHAGKNHFHSSWWLAVVLGFLAALSVCGH